MSDASLSQSVIWGLVVIEHVLLSRSSISLKILHFCLMVSSLSLLEHSTCLSLAVSRLNRVL